jgi:hypothetical protein
VLFLFVNNTAHDTALSYPFCLAQSTIGNLLHQVIINSYPHINTFTSLFKMARITKIIALVASSAIAANAFTGKYNAMAMIYETKSS